MATVLFGISMISIISGASTSFLINALTNTTTSVYSYLNRINGYDHPYITCMKKQLDKIDLQFSIDIINEILKDQSKKHKEASESLKHAIYGVNEILKQIAVELQTIDEAIKYHHSKYFSRWRQFDCKCNIDTIKNNKKILDKRYKIFIDLLKLEEIKKN